MRKKNKPHFFRKNKHGLYVSANQSKGKRVKGIEKIINESKTRNNTPIRIKK